MKWNPHIHALVSELVYDPVKDEVKTFDYFNFSKLRNTFMYEILRLMEEQLPSSFKRDKRTLYTKCKTGFYVYAKKMQSDQTYNEQNASKNLNSCITYSIRYVGRPAKAECHIIKYF